jgi:hypothetical protein
MKIQNCRPYYSIEEKVGPTTNPSWVIVLEEDDSFKFNHPKPETAKVKAPPTNKPM